MATASGMGAPAQPAQGSAIGAGGPPTGSSWSAERQAQDQARLRFLVQSLEPEQRLDFSALAAPDHVAHHPPPAPRSPPGGRAAPVGSRASHAPPSAPVPARTARAPSEVAPQASGPAPSPIVPPAESPLVAHSTARVTVRETAPARSRMPLKVALASCGLLMALGVVAGPSLMAPFWTANASPPPLPAPARTSDKPDGPVMAPPVAAAAILPIPVREIVPPVAMSPPATSVPAPSVPVMAAPAAPIPASPVPAAPVPAPSVPVLAAPADGPDIRPEIVVDLLPPDLPEPAEFGTGPLDLPTTMSADMERPASTATDASAAGSTAASDPVVIVPVADIPSQVVVADVSLILPPMDPVPDPQDGLAKAAAEPAPAISAARPVSDRSVPAGSGAPTVADLTEPSTTAMVARAQAILALGDISGARLLLKRAAELGDPAAKAKLAQLPATTRGTLPAARDRRP